MDWNSGNYTQYEHVHLWCGAQLSQLTRVASSRGVLAIASLIRVVMFMFDCIVKTQNPDVDLACQN